MALDLLACTPVVKVPRRPTESLQIRIGLHTGPVMAGYSVYSENNFMV